MNRRHPLLVARRIIWKRIEQPFRMRWLEGLQIVAYPTDETSRVIFLTGRYEPNEFRLLRSLLQPGMTVMDVGANLGLYTLFAARRVGPEGMVLSIEPSPREFVRLTANVNGNQLGNVRLLRTAISDHSGEALLRVATDCNAGHNTLGRFGYDEVRLQDEELVPVRPLDEVVEEEGLKRVDLVKMDIEGAELFALEGAISTLRRLHPILLLELADRTLRNQGCESGAIWKLLESLDYRIYSFDRTTGEPVPALQKPYYDSENVLAVHASQVPGLTRRGALPDRRDDR